MGLLPSWSATDALALQRRVESSCKRQYPKSYFANWASVVSHLLLLLNCASTALDASVISNKVRIEVTGASVYLHCRHSAGLLQRYSSRNSWQCDKTAAISSENCRSFSIRNNFPGPLSLFYAAPNTGSGVAQNRFQEHSPALPMNSAYDRLKSFEVVLGCRHQLHNQCQKYRH